jgi:NADH-quinone oxidoreductase subunit J
MIELIAFFVIAGIAVGSALAMITARNLVHAVLFMVAHFAMAAVLFLMLQAPFLAAVQVIVYAGAIMVLFLFVVMLMGPQQITLTERIAGQRWLGIVLVAILLVALLSVVSTNTLTGQLGTAAPGDLGVRNPQRLGELLYTKYVFPFEIVSVLLLVAMVGAVVLAMRQAYVRRVTHPDPEADVDARRPEPIEGAERRESAKAA